MPEEDFAIELARERKKLGGGKETSKEAVDAVAEAALELSARVADMRALAQEPRGRTVRAGARVRGAFARDTQVGFGRLLALRTLTQTLTQPQPKPHPEPRWGTAGRWCARDSNPNPHFISYSNPGGGPRGDGVRGLGGRGHLPGLPHRP